MASTTVNGQTVWAEQSHLPTMRYDGTLPLWSGLARQSIVQSPVIIYYIHLTLSWQSSSLLRQRTVEIVYRYSLLTISADRSEHLKPL